MDKNVMMEFMEDGRLIYTVDLGHMHQIMNLSFQVDGDRIVTDQPSSPRLDQTRFSFETPDRLVLQHDAQRSWFQRI